MARLVWRYSDDAGALIENVYKFCMEEKKSGMKLSLNHVWYRTAAITDVSRSTGSENCGREVEGMTSSSLGPVVNILTIFSNANILKKIREQKDAT